MLKQTEHGGASLAWPSPFDPSRPSPPLFSSIMTMNRWFKRTAHALIPQTHLLALEAIYHCGEEGHGISVSTLAKRLHSSTPSVSRMLGSMEKQHLIERTPDPTDRRSTLVTLTSEGERMHNEIRLLFDEYMQIVFAQLGENRIHELEANIDEITLALKTGFETLREAHPEIQSATDPCEGCDGR